MTILPTLMTTVAIHVTTIMALSHALALFQLKGEMIMIEEEMIMTEETTTEEEMIMEEGMMIEEEMIMIGGMTEGDMMIGVEADITLHHPHLAQLLLKVLS